MNYIPTSPVISMPSLAKAIMIVDGAWIESSLLAVKTGVPGGRNLGPIESRYGLGWQKTHRVDYKILNSIVEDNLSNEFSRLSIMKSLVLVESGRTEAIEEMALNNFVILSLMESPRVIEAAVMSGVFQHACILTGSPVFAHEVYMKIGAYFPLSLVSVRSTCDKTLLKMGVFSGATWLEDRLDDFVRPYLFAKKLPRPVPQTETLLETSPAASHDGAESSRRSTPSPPPLPNVAAARSPALHGPMSCPEMCAVHDKVLNIVHNFVATRHSSPVSSRTIGRFLSSQHASLLETLKTKLGGLKSLVRNHPELFKMTLSVDGKEFTLSLLKECDVCIPADFIVPLDHLTDEEDGYYSSDDTSTSTSVTPTLMVRRSAAPITSSSSALSARDAAASMLTDLIYKRVVANGGSMSSRDLGRFLIITPVASHPSALAYIKADFTCLRSFIATHTEAFFLTASFDGIKEFVVNVKSDCPLSSRQVFARPFV